MAVKLNREEKKPFSTLYDRFTLSGVFTLHIKYGSGKSFDKTLNYNFMK